MGKVDVQPVMGAVLCSMLDRDEERGADIPGGSKKAGRGKK
jgi:hypothetical protein